MNFFLINYFLNAVFYYYYFVLVHYAFISNQSIPAINYYLYYYYHILIDISVMAAHTFLS